MPPSPPRLPAQVPKEIFDPKHEGRKNRLLSHKEYYYIRRLQFEHQFKTGHPLQGIFSDNLETPVFIGAKNEAAAFSEKYPLGRGSYGYVYPAISLDDGHPYALKHLNMQHSKTQQEHYEHESEILDSLGRLIDKLSLESHDKVILQELGYGESYAYFKEETATPISFKDKCLMAFKAAQALEKIHQKGILHKDIKLNNMLWDPIDQKCHLIDFGLATHMDQEGKSKGKLEGTELYTAPELFKNSSLNAPSTFTKASDVYAMGMVFLQLFSKYDLKITPRSITLEYLQGDQTEGISASLASNFKDVINTNHHPVYSLVKKMLDINPENRPKLNEVISVLTNNLQLDCECKPLDYVSSSHPQTKRILNAFHEQAKTSKTSVEPPSWLPSPWLRSKRH